MHNNRTPTGPVSVSAPVSVNAPAPACGADCPTNYPSGNVDNRLIMSAAARLGDGQQCPFPPQRTSTVM